VTFWIDVRLAARLLLKDKWFTLAAVAALDMRLDPSAVPKSE
jgi:hypothetical protein